jgi:hypothetical protein
MDTLTFFSEITKTLVWPLAIVAIILVLKKPLRVLILSLRRFQYGELAIEFGRQVYDLTGKFAKIIPDNDKLKFPGADEPVITPREAVERSVRDLEKAMREKISNKGLNQNRIELYDKLTTLGRMATQNPERALDPNAVRAYLWMARRMTELLRSF